MNAPTGSCRPVASKCSARSPQGRRRRRGGRGDRRTRARTDPDRERVTALLYRFYRRCANADLPELERLATTVQTWWPQIVAFIHTGITNAGSEGTNRGSRRSPATAYGVRNLVNQRLRTRCATT
nr:transposase [Micromonospora veneta]